MKKRNASLRRKRAAHAASRTMFVAWNVGERTGLRKALVLAILFFIVLIVGSFFAAAYLFETPLGESKISGEFVPTFWKVTSGQTLQLSIRIRNNGWQFALAKNIKVDVLAPQNFLIPESGTNKYTLHFGVLRGGELQEKTFNVTIPPLTSSGNYNVTAKISADNALEQTLIAQINVTQRIYP